MWGQELWDAYDRVAARLTANTTTLTSTYAKLLRDKAEVSTYIYISIHNIYIIIYLSTQVEAEYARGLRRLVARYSPGPSSQDQDTSAETEMVTRVLEEVSTYLHLLLSTYVHTILISTHSVSRWVISLGSTRSWRTALPPSSARWIHI